MNVKETLKGFFVPGFLKPHSRVVYFLLFLILTILQTYFSLQLEEQQALDTKYDNVKI